jgi:hypothetical protein
MGPWFQESIRMTANESVRSAAPDELTIRLARLGLPARGAQHRQATLPTPLRRRFAPLGLVWQDPGP